MTVSDYSQSVGQKAGSRPIPQHIAIIMDGNGRWAQARGQDRRRGHIQGKNVVKTMVKACLERKVKVLTLFTFGKENWKRPPSEVRHLFRLFYVVLHRELTTLAKEGVRLQVFGDTDKLDPSLVKAIDMAHKRTEGNDTLYLNLMLNYSGRWDLKQAIAKAHEAGTDPSDFESHLCLHPFDEPDLFIRTAGVQRISNFMLWELAYTEMYFTETYWPDFDATALDQAISFYGQQERRFGLISDQVEKAHA